MCKFLMLSITIEFILFFYVRRNLIVLGSDSILVGTMFATKRIPISELVGVRLEAGVMRCADRFKPMFRLVFVTDIGDVVSNTKLYSSKDLDRVVRFVESRV